MKWDLRKKILVIAALQLLVVVGVLFGFYYVDAKDSVRSQYVEKARSVILTTEATREEMGKKWQLGIFSAEQMSEWAETGAMDKVLAAVPVVTAWEAAMAKADEGGYEFRVPKFSPRNPKNEPDELESRVLRMFEEEGVEEYSEVDESMNAIRYFRPIKLTQECMLCHGDPATSVALWDNDKGLDPTGVRMENWKVGEVHGAFEVVQSLDAADAAIAASLGKAAGLVGVLLLAGSGVFFYLLTRSVIKPINRIIGGLNDGADQVNDAAAQVSSSSQELAAGASEQASSLEETSSALEEMAAMTRTSAENAKEANELTNQARSAAETGDQTMGQLNGAMTAINEASGKISKIIKVIEEIAFQTNLLALNAAVEAARAGEHGKGFAVVADEVRNLAQRAAEAARETTGLIEDSVNKAKDGTDISSNVGQALGAIVGDVSKVADLVNGIARASQEQAQGVDQVNSAVSQMDGVTQQNAAGAEESASAAEQLSAQAAVVKSAVGDLAFLVTGRQGDLPGNVTHAHQGPNVAKARLGSGPPKGFPTAPSKGGGTSSPGATAGNKGAAPKQFMSLDDGNLEEF